LIGGFQQPKSAVDRKFLGPLGPRIDGQPARGRAVDLRPADCAEVTRAEEGCDLVELVRAVDRKGDLEAGEGQLARRFLETAVAEIELHAVYDDWRCLAVFDNADRDRLLVDESGGKELDLE